MSKYPDKYSRKSASICEGILIKKHFTLTNMDSWIEKDMVLCRTFFAELVVQENQ